MFFTTCLDIVVELNGETLFCKGKLTKAGGLGGLFNTHYNELDALENCAALTPIFLPKNQRLLEVM